MIEAGTTLTLAYFGPARVNGIITDPHTFERVAMIYTKTAQLTLSIKYCEKVAAKEKK